ncbi:MAG: T9SS type A sorting domain-containing protein, partial [Candidatus Cloacimonetes bacterium]|nr:T9SS type A sorting domain-containing protein [Candidatus Cloacimonadota bacterium]
WLLIPAAWTQISFDLSQYAGQQVYFAWNCVSWDALALCLDEIVITQAISNEDNNCPPVVNALIYPNPAKDWFTIVSEDKSLFDLNIYNLKGQKVASVKQMSSYTWQKDKDAPLKSGLYILKVKSRHHTKTYKLLIR